MKTYNQNDIDMILNNQKLQKAITKYEYLINHINQIDDIYIKTFCSLFNMRQHSFSKAPSNFNYKHFIDKYFNYFRQICNDPSITFEDVFNTVSGFSYRDELSFSSKMFHLLKPEYPIWDSILRNKDHFNTIRKDGTKLDQYYDYKDKFDKYINSAQGKLIIDRFNCKFCNCNISNTKKIDFVLWQDR